MRGIVEISVSIGGGYLIPISGYFKIILLLKIGNAGGVNLTFNGEDLGPLGDPGKVVRLRLTPKGYEFIKRDDFEIPGYGDEVKPPDAY